MLTYKSYFVLRSMKKSTSTFDCGLCIYLNYVFDFPIVYFPLLEYRRQLLVVTWHNNEYEKLNDTLYYRHHEVSDPYGIPMLNCSQTCFQYEVMKLCVFNSVWGLRFYESLFNGSFGVPGLTSGYGAY